MIMVEKKINIKMEKGILLKENMKKQKPRLSGGECLQKKTNTNRVTSPPIYSAREIV